MQIFVILNKIEHDIEDDGVNCFSGSSSTEVIPLGRLGRWGEKIIKQETVARACAPPQPSSRIYNWRRAKPTDDSILLDAVNFALVDS